MKLRPGLLVSYRQENKSKDQVTLALESLGAFTSPTTHIYTKGHSLRGKFSNFPRPSAIDMVSCCFLATLFSFFPNGPLSSLQIVFDLSPCPPTCVQKNRHVGAHGLLLFHDNVNFHIIIVVN